MKRSLIISAIILILGAILGWRELRHLSRVQDSHSKLVAEITALGVNRDDGQSQKITSPTRHRERPATETDGKVLAQAYIAYSRNPKNSNIKYWELYARIQKLSLTEFKLFVAEFYDLAKIEEGDIDNLKDMIHAYSQKYPSEMAQMISKSPEIMNHDSHEIDTMFYSLIYYWAYKKQDSLVAFQSLAAAAPSFQSKNIDVIIKGAQYHETRIETLAAMRDFATTPEQLELVNKNMSLLTFGEGREKLGYDEVTSWIASANLSSEELAGATQGMQEKVRIGETAQWLDWLAKSEVPDEISKERAFELAAQWTEKDYQAVGQWLNSSPDSPEKTAVAGAYAAKAYPYHPENAMKWIQTIPQGPDRSKALETIYQSMPKNSDQAKAFASEHALNK